MLSNRPRTLACHPGAIWVARTWPEGDWAAIARSIPLDRGGAVREQAIQRTLSLGTSAAGFDSRGPRQLRDRVTEATARRRWAIPARELARASPLPAALLAAAAGFVGDAVGHT